MPFATNFTSVMWAKTYYYEEKREILTRREKHVARIFSSLERCAKIIHAQQTDQFLSWL